MLRIIIAEDDSWIQCKIGNKKIQFNFPEQLEIFDCLVAKIKPHVVIWRINDNEFYIDLREPYITFVYRWLKGIEKGYVLKEQIDESKLLNYIHGEP
jgi:hypothetical protein